MIGRISADTRLQRGGMSEEEEEEAVTEEGRTEDDNDGRLEQCNACVSALCRSPSLPRTDEKAPKRKAQI
ncbi:hypothetical protein V8C34DRAFT_293499, partial [Trichoderma compactum]